MKKLVSSLAVILVLSVAAFSQAIPGANNAASFLWHARVISGNSSTGSGTIIIAGAGGGAGGATLPNGRTLSFNQIFSTLTPVIVDFGQVNAEYVTPTAVSVANCPGGSVGANVQCATITATFANTHGNSADVIDGTFGIQSAVNAAAGTGGWVVIDGAWTAQFTTGPTGAPASASANIAAVVPFSQVALFDQRGGGAQLWTPTQAVSTVIATPATLTATTVGFGLNGANTTGGTYTGASTYHYCIAYVDIMGNEGPCSADFSAATAGTGTTNQIGFSAPAASAGAVGYVPYISLAGGTYALSYRVPLTSTVCTLTRVETVISACAVANTTYGQSGSAAIVSALTLSTSRIWIGTGGTSSTSDYVGNSNARTSYLYAPSNHLGTAGLVSASMPFTGATAPATTVPAVLGTLQLPAGFMNYIGRTIRICGLAKEAAAGSTSTITSIQLWWDADGSNVAGVPVLLGGPVVTATLVTANADQWQFCQDIKTTVSGAGATAGSILAGAGSLTESYGAATTVSAAAGPTIGAAAVGSLNLAGEARIHVVYLHTTGTDGATPILQDLTVESVN